MSSSKETSAVNNQPTNEEDAMSDVSAVTPAVINQPTNEDNTMSDVSAVTPAVNNQPTNEEDTMPDVNVVTPAVINQPTNEDNTMSDVNVVTPDDTKLNNHISKMNDAINTSKTSNVDMFDVFSDAYNEFYNDVRSYKSFKDGINLDSSSINKMEKICKSEIISKYAEKLPISWGTLHTIAIMKEVDILDAIDSGKFNSKTTKKEVGKYKKELKAERDASADATVNVEGDTSDGATPETDADILERNFFEQVGSSFSERKAIDEKGHKEIQRALKIINKYYDINPVPDDKKSE